MDKSYCVYVHVFPNGKLYFGITSLLPEQRWGKDGSGYDTGSQPVVWQAIKKYGWENIEHIIIEDGLTLEEASKMECELISKYKTNGRTYGYEYGYNMTQGGDCNKGINAKAVICDGITYESITEFCEANNLKRGMVETWLKGKRGMRREWYDRGLRYKYCDNSQIRRAEGHSHTKKIMYDGVIYDTYRQLANYLGVSPASVTNWAKGKTRVPSNILDNGFSVIDSDIELESYEKNDPIFYDGQYFNSQRELARYMGITFSALWTYIHGTVKCPQEYIDKGLQINSHK